MNRKDRERLIILRTQKAEIQLEIDEILKREAFDNDKIDATILSRIVKGEVVTSEGDVKLTNALTRLRRNRVIENRGTRKNPIWIAL